MKVAVRLGALDFIHIKLFYHSYVIDDKYNFILSGSIQTAWQINHSIEANHAYTLNVPNTKKNYNLRLPCTPFKVREYNIH